MSLINLSTVRCDTIFLKAFVAWVSGDLAATQLLCLHCLNHLRFNPEFDHLACCLSVFAFCVQKASEENYPYHVIDILKGGRQFNSFKMVSSWTNLAKFDGTNENFLDLVRTATYSNPKSDIDGVISNGSGKCSPWGQKSHSLTVSDLEDLALFCVDNDFPELGLDFAVKAHILSQSLDFSMCNGSISSNVNIRKPRINPRLAEKLGMKMITTALIDANKSKRLPESDEENLVFTHMGDSLTSSETITLRQQKRCSILKSSPLGDMYTCSPISDANRQKSNKRVRFSLSDLHPPPHLEAEYGGRNNDKRYSDLLRRRNSHSDGDFFEFGLWQRFFHRIRSQENFSLCKFVVDLLTILLFISLIVIFTLLFVAMIFCVPLAWFSLSDVTSSQVMPISTDMCFQLLDCFYLRSLIT